MDMDTNTNTANLTPSRELKTAHYSSSAILVAEWADRYQPIGLCCSDGEALEIAESILEHLDTRPLSFRLWIERCEYESALSFAVRQLAKL